MLARCLNGCGASVRANRWTGKYSALANVKRVLIERREKSAQIASPITTCDICLQRGASNQARIFQPFRAGSDTKDGGTLAMKTYGQLRCEHSISQAQRVTFATVTAKQADVIPFAATA